MDNEFRIQVRVGTVMLANIVQGLKRRGETKAFKSANALVQEALRIAENQLVMEGTEEEEITYIDDAIVVLEDTELFNFGAISNERGMFRGRRKEVIREIRREEPRIRNRIGTGRTNAAGESENEAIINYAAQAFINERAIEVERERKRIIQEQEEEMRQERLRRIKEKLPSIDEMNSPRDFPGLYPEDRKGEVDLDSSWTKEQLQKKMEENEKEDRERRA